MEFLVVVKGLFDSVKEQFFGMYKRMKLVFAIFITIPLAPFIVAFAAVMLVLYLVNVFFHGAKMPCDYVKSNLTEDGNKVKPVTQAIIYFVGYGVIMFNYVLLGFFALSIFTLYFLASCFGFVVALGKIKFQPIINAKEEKEVKVVE